MRMIRIAFHPNDFALVADTRVPSCSVPWNQKSRDMVRNRMERTEAGSIEDGISQELFRTVCVRAGIVAVCVHAADGAGAGVAAKPFILAVWRLSSPSKAK